MTLYLPRKSVIRSLPRIIGLLLVTLALQACNAIKLGYNNGPDLAYWWLDAYVDFSSAQSVRLREELNRLQQWHRSRELPDYAGLLQQAQGMMAADVTPVQVCGLWGEVQVRLDRLLTAAAPAAAPLAQTLQPGQIEALERKYAKSNREFQNDWLDRTPEQVQAKRYDKALERAEMLYGKLDSDQRILLKQQMVNSSFSPQTQNAERLRRQQDTLQLLRGWLAHPPEPSKAVEETRIAMERLLRIPDASFRQHAQTMTQEACTGIAALHNRTTDAQRQHGIRWFRGYEKDLQELSAQR